MFTFIKVCLFCFTCMQISYSTPEIRKINPPKLGLSHQGQKIIAYRPMRKGSPRIEIEHLGNKIIAHNYGHGGSGWTLGPGSVQYIIAQLCREIAAKEISTNERITVIGAGIIGQLSALELLAKGYNNILIVAPDFTDTTSHNAGGLLAPVSMDNDPKIQKLIDEMVMISYKVYGDIAKGQHAYIKNGCRFMPSYFETRQESGLTPLVEAGLLSPAKDVVLDFQNGVRRAMVSYDDNLFIDTANLMVEIEKILRSKGVVFQQRMVHNIQDLQDRIIVHASGFGAKKLVNDHNMVSVQGHLIMLEDQNPADLEYMILVYFAKGKTIKGYPIKRSFYIFPKTVINNTNSNNVGVIGGTFVEVEKEQNEPHKEEFITMLNQARDFYFKQ